MSMSYEKERAVALEAVIKSCRLCDEVQRTLAHDDSVIKKDKSPVTVADYGSQALINMELMSYFPDDPVVSEENSALLKSPAGSTLLGKIKERIAGFHPAFNDIDIINAIEHGKTEIITTERYWAIDPIDGTKGFVRGDSYAVALALIENGEVVLGVLGCPNMGTSTPPTYDRTGAVFIAVKDKGSFTCNLKNSDEIRIQVSDVDEPSLANYMESVESEHSSQEQSAEVAKILGVQAPPIRLDGQCKYAALGRGDAVYYIRLPVAKDYEEKIWDHAAGWLIAKEAGGEVTDAVGRDIDFTTGAVLSGNTGIVASNGKFHSRILQAIKRVVG
ncbi:MAG: 3'(2'),5'-bisphosphate nucleotidase [Candidatus Dadabacteria bacterium]|nr:3'(2'),5'-bisphosphate nucleotidase [Candidatus Dadabacteria bacterium]